MRFNPNDLSGKVQKKLYLNMLKPRLIEQKMLVLLRQGKITKWFSGIGQEAIAVGVTSALKDKEYILPMHRNLGVFTSRNIPLQKLFEQWQGKAGGFTQGRDRSFHFGTQKHHIIGMISHLGPQMGVACGIALGQLLQKTKRVTAVFTGEGATSEGDFHEALNVASVWGLPVLFCIENNGYGLSTPTKEQYNCEHLVDRAKGYGIEGRIIDGNNILEVYQKVKALAKSMRQNPRPILLEFKTFRMRGHEEASGTAYVPEKLLQKWQSLDPITNYEAYMVKSGIASFSWIEAQKTRLQEQIDQQWQLANNTATISPNIDKEIKAVYAKTPQALAVNEKKEDTYRFVDAISLALRQSMQKYPQLILMGQDIADYGGVFKVTQGFLEQFGAARVRNTPICESIIVSVAMGLAVKGYKAVVEMQFADFVSSGFNPIVNYLAKVHYRWGQPADVVIRLPCGGGIGAGPFHSQTNEAWFTKTPGLKVVYPAFANDAKELLAAAIADPNPVLFFEHKALYRSIKSTINVAYSTQALGEANIVSAGKDCTIVAYGMAVHWALEILEQLTQYNAELIDLRCLQPLDVETIYQSVQKTSRLLIVHEDSVFCGIGGEIAALVAENCFAYLDAPIKRLGALETPIPFNKDLEEQYLPKNRIAQALQQLMAY